MLAAGAWTGPLSRLIGAAAAGPSRQGLQHRRRPVTAAERDQPVRRQGRGHAADPQPAAGRNDGVRRSRRGAEPDPDRRHPAGTGSSTSATGRRPAPDTITPRAGIRPMTPDGLPIIGRLGDLTQRATCPPATACRASRLGPGSALALTELVLRGEAARRAGPVHSCPLHPGRRRAVPAAGRSPLTDHRWLDRPNI